MGVDFAAALEATGLFGHSIETLRAGRRVLPVLEIDVRHVLPFIEF